MRSISATLLLIFSFAGQNAVWAIEAAVRDQSRDIALQWLSLLDADRIDESWAAASSLFQSAISQVDWSRAVMQARGPFGSPGTRELLGATYAETLPGAPDGEYVVMQFQTEFERKAQAIETVTTMKEADGTWRVSGYFIK